MTALLSKEDIQDRICQLVYRAETFLNWSNQLFDLYEKKRESFQDPIIRQKRFVNKPIVNCIILHNVLYFQEAVICLRTLFEERRPPVEISFSYYFFNFENNNLENKINDIRNEYRTVHLNKFINKLIAHKQADLAGEPIVGFLNPIKKEHIEKASSIVKNLRNLTNVNFNCPANNYFENFYNPGFEIFYKTCESEFKKIKTP